MPMPRHILSPHHPRRNAFTIIEILVVVAIIAALVAILIPSLSRAKTSSMVAACKTELGSIQQGLQQYYNDFHMYPPSSGLDSSGNDSYLGNSDGTMKGRSPAMLAQGLLGYLPYDKDGAGPTLSNKSPSPVQTDSPYSFRTRLPAMSAAMGAGKPYGPYMQTDPKVLQVNKMDYSKKQFDESFIDPWGHEILYYLSQRPVADASRPAVTQVFNPQNTSGTDNYYFLADDCTMALNSDGNVAINPLSPSQTGASMAKFFPLINNGNATNTPNGTVTGADSFLLISAGPDGKYFTADDIVVSKN